MSVKDPFKTLFQSKSLFKPQAKSKRSYLNSTLSPVITCLLAGIALPLYALKVHEKQDYTDFSVYYLAATRAKAFQWEQIYSLQDGSSPFRYPPLFIPFFRPFAELGIVPAQMTWYFLQFFWFALGFYWIHKTLQICLRKTNSIKALTVTCLGILFVFRFCVDTFTIGQVSSLMFLGFSASLYFWVIQKPTRMALSLLVPTLFKIGPGFLFGIFSSSRAQIKKQVLLSSLFTAGVFSLIPLFWTGSWKASKMLWLDWLKIVVNDSAYYDSSHYGSQSLNSFLLRSIQQGWLSSFWADRIHLALTLSICTGIFLFWWLRRARNFSGRALFFSLGLFAYIWLMPETFKYSLTPLAIPAVFLFSAQPKNRFLKFFIPFSLLFGVFTLSLGGKDLVGDFLFFGLQKSSVPLLASVFLAVCIFGQAWSESAPTTFAKKIFHTLFPKNPKNQNLLPWTHLPKELPAVKLSVLIPVALEPSFFSDPDRSIEYLNRLQQSLSTSDYFQHQKVDQKLEESSGSEILLIFWGSRISQEHPFIRRLNKLVNNEMNLKNSSIRIVFDHHAQGRGAALRTGFLAAGGSRILLTSLEQVVEPDFIREALKPEHAHLDLIRGNRRDPQSHFRIPVRFLSLIYRRHRLGILFNFLIELLLPISSQDIGSDHILISRRLANGAFASQGTESSLFYLELDLVSQSHGYLKKEIPVSIALNLEKSFSRVFLEILEIGMEFPRLWKRFKNHSYEPLPQLNAITADDWGLSPGVNQGILKLARLGIVKRVSLLANCPHLETGLKELAALPGVELGLHFNLTYGRPLQPLEKDSPLKVLIPSPVKVLFSWLMRGSETKSGSQAFDFRKFVRLELQSQLNQLKELGVAVQYLDGHHHIHLLPGLLAQNADLIQKAGIRQIRLPFDLALWKTKQAPLLILSILAQQSFKKNGFQAMPCLYPDSRIFKNHSQLRGTLVSKLMKTLNTEIIVHPAETNDIDQLEFKDTYTTGRVLEFQSLQMLSVNPA